MKKYLLPVLFFACLSVSAQDRLFTYTYQSTVLNKGQKEIEVWNTLRTGREDFYARLDHRTEFEIGLGNKLQTAFYLNLTSKTKTTTENTTKTIETENKFSFSNEWKLKLLDPVANPVGLAVYGEYGIGSNEFEFEGKLILDKKLNKLTLAANAIYELELEPVMEANVLDWKKENKADLHLAAAWSFSPSFALTLESAYKNVYDGKSLEHSALYAGPGFSYATTHFWVNCTVMPQLTAFKGKTNGGLNLKEFEKSKFRLLFSYVF